MTNCVDVYLQMLTIDIAVEVDFATEINTKHECHDRKLGCGIGDDFYTQFIRRSMIH